MYKSFLLISVLILIAEAIYPQATFPLNISSDKRYLVDANNKPFPILGRTAWCVITLPDSDYKKFLDNTIEHGCNAIEMSVITHWASGNHAPFNANGDAPFLKQLNGEKWSFKLIYDSINIQAPDFLTPNEKYWSHVDDFLTYCETKGIAVLMFPCYLGYNGGDQGWMQELVANGQVKAEAYGAWFANRYKNRKNIIWMLMGDMGSFNEEQKNAEAAFIKGLKSVPDQQSIFYSAESSSGENSADNMYFGKEMTLNGCYTWTTNPSVPNVGHKGYMHEPVVPSFLLEEPYDEEGPDGNAYNPNAVQPVRRFEWWGWLSTIGGYIAGNGYIWQFIDPVWQQHLNTQAALDMKRLNGFIQSVNWWQLIPSGLNSMTTLIADSNNIDTGAAYISAAATKDGSLMVVYIPPAHEGNITVDMSVLTNKIYGYWFDPTNAKYSAIINTELNTKGLHSFVPPGKNSSGDNDWVLILSSKKR